MRPPLLDYSVHAIFCAQRLAFFLEISCHQTLKICLQPFSRSETQQVFHGSVWKRYQSSILEFIKVKWCRWNEGLCLKTDPEQKLWMAEPALQISSKSSCPQGGENNQIHPTSHKQASLRGTVFKSTNTTGPWRKKTKSAKNQWA